MCVCVCVCTCVRVCVCGGGGGGGNGVLCTRPNLAPKMLFFKLYNVTKYIPSAAPLTDQLRELVKAMPQEQRTNKVEQMAPADMQRHTDLEPNVLDDLKNVPFAPMIHLDLPIHPDL